MATTLEGFIQQVAVACIGKGYFYYVTGRVPDGKDPRSIDRKLAGRYGATLSKWSRYRRKRGGHANVRYLRHERFFVLFATDGVSPFFEREAGLIRDCRREPFKYGGYSISSKAGRTCVRIEREQYKMLKAAFLELAPRRSPERLERMMATLPFEPSGSDLRFVRLQHGNLEVQFDTWFGGAPLVWKYQGTEIIDSHPGLGFQQVIEEGQDPTQAGANGETVLRIARNFDNPTDLAYRNYYIREAQPNNTPSTWTYYKVTGFYPDFWQSADPEDDAIPPLANGQPQDGWIVQYRYNPEILPLPYRDLPYPDRGGTPVYFQHTANQSSGIFMEGNEVLNPIGNYRWNERLREIPNGRVAFRCRISLEKASPDAFAGIMFCRSVPTGAGKTMNDAYSSPGYFLNVNRQGLIEFRRHDNVVVWSQVNATVQAAVNVIQGCLVEVRTFNNNENIIEIWAEQVKLAAINLPATTRLKGPHFGLYAYTSTNPNFPGPYYVKFSDREVFNVGTEIESTLTPLSDGSVETDLFVHNAAHVSERRRLYRATTVAFLRSGVNLNSAWTERPRGTIFNGPTNNGFFDPYLLNVQPNPAAALWAGKSDGTLGMYCVPTTVEFAGDNVNPRGEHALVSASTPNPPDLNKSLLHLNAMPKYPGPPTAPWTATGVRLKAKWWGFRQP